MSFYPSLLISISNIGTIPLLWHILPNSHNPNTFYWIAKFDGVSSPILKVDVHFANTHPNSWYSLILSSSQWLPIINFSLNSKPFSSIACYPRSMLTPVYMPLFPRISIIVLLSMSTNDISSEFRITALTHSSSFVVVKSIFLKFILFSYELYIPIVSNYCFIV